ncbi:MAG: FAD-binding oxidoreductase, partial [Acidobacteria bacterium]|nr:FAD-binding oxidoreductase [Acidobacteriota bacterium]
MSVSGPLPSPSAPSFWLSRQRPVERLDHVVIGGGLVGLSTAYWLARSGHRVTVLEAGDLATRASGRNAGFLLTGSAEPLVSLAASVGEDAALAFWRLSRDNRELLRSELIDSGRVDCEFVAEGSWIAA